MLELRTSVRVLGELEVDGPAGSPVTPTGALPRSLLALLLLEAPAAVPQDRLLDVLWDGTPPQSGAAALHVHVSTLRRSLSGTAVTVERTASGYRADVAADAVDVRVFEGLVSRGESELAERPAAAVETLSAALGLWAGAALPEFAYEGWAQPHLARLEEVRLLARERLAEARLLSGDAAAAVPELEALAAEAPLRERVWALLMRALYGSGRQADALAAFQRARSMLIDDLGLEPGPELTEVHRAVLGHDEALAFADRAATSVSNPQSSILLATTGAAGVDALGIDLWRADPDSNFLVLGIVDGSADVADTNAALELGTAHALDVATPLRAAGAEVQVAAVADLGADALSRFAARHDVRLFVSLLSSSGDGLLAAHEQALLYSAPPDVALYIPRESLDSSAGAIVVPFGGSEHDWAALELGAVLARGRRAELMIVAPVDRSIGDSTALLAGAAIALQRVLGVEARVRVADGVQGLLAESARAAYVVAGVPLRWRHTGLGLARAALVRELAVPVVFVRRGLRPGILAPGGSTTQFTWTLAARSDL